MLGTVQLGECTMQDESREAGTDEAALTISPEKVCFIIVKAREFDAKDDVTEPDPGSNPSDDKNVSVLEEPSDDPVLEELTSLADSLSEDEQIDLVTLMWLGRNDYAASDWSVVREEPIFGTSNSVRLMRCVACRATYLRCLGSAPSKAITALLPPVRTGGCGTMDLRIDPVLC